MEKHISVLLNEAINYLDVKTDGVYIDMTLGYGGHSSEILKKNKKGLLYCFDKDIDAINESNERLKKIGTNYKIFNTGFINAKDLVEEQVDGILYDLGVSSVELDERTRGFSYMKDSTLDMRMDQSAFLTAKEVVNTYSVSRLTKIFREYGEEKHALKIATKIDEYRKVKEIETTLELVDIIDKCYPYKEKRNSHPAKKVFQAIRIEVNNELEELETSLRNSLSMLKVGGVIVVITFHSLEDRIVKKIFKEVTEVDPLIKGMPNMDKSLYPDYELLTKKAILPTLEEINHNSRAKSAKLRCIKKVK